MQETQDITKKRYVEDHQHAEAKVIMLQTRMKHAHHRLLFLLPNNHVVVIKTISVISNR